MITKEQEEYLLNPPPGSAAERAKEFGIDLTLTVDRLQRTSEQRLVELQSFVEQIEELRESVRRSRQQAQP